MITLELDSIRLHLASAGTDLVEVGTARDLAAAQELQIAYPSAWLVHLAESAGPNRYQTRDLVDQRVEAGFGVILALRDLGRAAVSPALTEAERVRRQVLQALAAFVPAGADSACVPRRGRLLSGIDKDGRLFWQDDFTVTFNRRLGVTP
jgi:hypothetical protein